MLHKSFSNQRRTISNPGCFIFWSQGFLFLFLKKRKKVHFKAIITIVKERNKPQSKSRLLCGWASSKPCSDSERCRGTFQSKKQVGEVFLELWVWGDGLADRNTCHPSMRFWIQAFRTERRQDDILSSLATQSSLISVLTISEKVVFQMLTPKLVLWPPCACRHTYKYIHTHTHMKVHTCINKAWCELRFTANNSKDRLKAKSSTTSW